MQRLILLRHAKAEPRAASGEDFDRSLAARGHDDARLMGRVLAEAGIKPSVALVSPARRTRETWEDAAEALGAADVRLEKGLYNATSRELRRMIEPFEYEDGELILVGHNPGLHQLVIELLVEGAAPPSAISRAATRFPTATAAVFDMDVAGRLTWDGLYLASEHGGGAGE